MKAMINWEIIDQTGYSVSREICESDDYSVEVELDESMYEQFEKVYERFFEYQEILEKLFKRKLAENKRLHEKV